MEKFSYNIPDGTYAGKAVAASCYEKDGKLRLDIKVCLVDPTTGQWMMNPEKPQYVREFKKVYFLTSKDGNLNERTIESLKEIAKGYWNPKSFDDFYWWQTAVDGKPFANLEKIGELEFNLVTNEYGQSMFIHDPARSGKAGGTRKAFVPDGAESDKAKLAAKWGGKARALFAASPRKMESAPVAAPAPAAKPMTAPVSKPSRPAMPPTPAKPAAEHEPWADYPHTPDGCFKFFTDNLGEPYDGTKHDALWFECMDAVANGKDPDEYTDEDTTRLFKVVMEKLGNR